MARRGEWQEERGEPTYIHVQETLANLCPANMPHIITWCMIYKVVDDSLTRVALAQGATLQTPRQL